MGQGQAMGPGPGPWLGLGPWAHGLALALAYVLWPWPMFYGLVLWPGGDPKARGGGPKDIQAICEFVAEIQKYLRN